MKKETPTQVYSFCEIFINFSSERLLLSMKETTKNCSYCRESCKYDSTVNEIYTVLIEKQLCNFACPIKSKKNKVKKNVE